MVTVSFPFNKANLNLITLSFLGDLEEDFLAEYFNKSLKHVRIALLLSIFFYGIFGILDALLVPEAKERLWVIRYSIFIPYAFTIFLFSFSSRFKKYMQIILTSVVVLAGMGIIMMILIAPYPGNYSYYAGLILVLIYGYTFFKLRFIWATLAGWILVVGYEIAAIWLSETPVPILINNNFFFLTGNIFGMFACYSIEFYSRRDFVQARMIEAERKKVHAANRALEKRVQERTEELTLSNEELKEEIEERKQAEKALRESEEKYRSIIEDIEEGYFEVDVAGNLVFFNDSLCKITGFQKDELLGVNNREYTSHETAKKMYQTFSEVYRSGISAKMIDYEVVKKDGNRMILEMSVTLMKGGSGKPIGFRGLVRDVTERKRVEEELKKSKEIAEAANLAKSEFLANMSHELRTPLNHIIGFTEIIVNKHYGNLNAVQEEYLNDVLQSSRHLLSLINDILDLSRVEAGRIELETIDLSPRRLLENSLDMIREKAVKHRLQMSIDTDGVPEIIKGDERKLKQILYNLLSNAVKFTNDGGRLSLNARVKESLTRTGLQWKESGDSRMAEGLQEGLYNAVEKGKRYVEFSVSDDGIGINQEDLLRIFGRFEQVDGSAKKKYQGAGLGLYLAKNLVELHGGKIWAESEGPNKGSTFRFLIPV